MKKLLTLTSVLFLSSAAVAGFTGNNNQAAGGFTGKGQMQAAIINTVAQALKAGDDEMVQLTGVIIRQLDKDEFILRDHSGEIKIEVEDNAWQGQQVGFNEKITVYGKVDHETVGKNSVDVYRIQKH